MGTLADANGYVAAPARPAALRLFCFHHAGGGASLYRGWQRAIGPHVAVCPVLLPGREGRAAEPRFTQLDALVADLDAKLGDLLAEPHVCFGHSMGALVAYRLACHRRARGESLPRALLLSSYPAPHLAAPMPEVDERDDDALIGLLTGTGGLAPQVLDWPGGLTELLAVARDDLRLCAGHRDRGEAPLPCPIHVFGADADALVGEPDLRAWDRQAASPVDLHVLPGDHFFIRDDPAPLLEQVRWLLRRYM
ncbi:MAG: alpha/beta fold hydrolase [Solirubrobacteraceae bacterium]|nr:alpha/beta fold hydrolase [Solirubrobacteraceae bacterium]